MSEVHASLAPHRGGRPIPEADAGDIHARLARQSLARPLTELEVILADVLEDIFASGISDFDAVASALTERGVTAPLSRDALWTAASLQSELASINRSLDQAYEHGHHSA